MTTDLRLKAYNPEFSDQTIDAVAEVAEWQQTFGSYEEFFEAANVPELKKHTFNGVTVEVLDIEPEDYDRGETIVYHLPMACQLDANMIYQAATVASANPGLRLIAVGNPGVGYLAQLGKEDNRLIKSGSLKPAVEPLITYLDDNDIYDAKHVGYSAGVDLAIATMTHNGPDSSAAVLIEPASVKYRSLPMLGLAFLSSNKHLESYVEATGLKTFKDAKNDADNMATYVRGLASPTNRAFAKFISSGLFTEKLAEAVKSQKYLETVSVVWGSESELALDGIVSNIMNGYSTALTRVGAYDVLEAVRLEGQYHALANDIHLQAALVRDSLTLQDINHGQV